MCVVTAVLLATAMGAGAPSQRPPAGVRLWQFDPSTGNYYLSAVVDTVPHLAVFTPAVYIEPLIVASIRRNDGTFSFSYSISNGKNSRQPLRSCVLLVTFPAEALSTPVGWDAILTPSRGRFRWTRLGGSLNIGESQEGFALQAQALPGVSRAECRGRTPTPVLENWFTEQAVDELYRLTDRDHVEVPVIAPVIAVSDSDGVGRVLSRIRVHYGGALNGAVPPAFSPREN